MTHRTITIFVGVHWSTSMLFATMEFSIEVLKGTTPFSAIAFTFLTLDIIILISFLVTYWYFYSRVKKIRAMESNAVNRPSQNRQTLFFKKFKVPCYIVLTYICFNISSLVLFICSRYTGNKKLTDWLLEISDIPIVTGFVSDACIYILANKDVRRLLISIFRREQIEASNRVRNFASTSGI